MRECNQCGKCCIKYADGGLSATSEEIAWWEATRPDIARYVHNGQIWCDPDTHAPLTYCPWLSIEATKDNAATRYGCSIYRDRPEDCRQYPTSIGEMVVDECEMLEVRDFRDTDLAQKRLDGLKRFP